MGVINCLESTKSHESLSNLVFKWYKLNFQLDKIQWFFNRKNDGILCSCMYQKSDQKRIITCVFENSLNCFQLSQNCHKLSLKFNIRVKYRVNFLKFGPCQGLPLLEPRYQGRCSWVAHLNDNVLWILNKLKQVCTPHHPYLFNVLSRLYLVNN